MILFRLLFGLPVLVLVAAAGLAVVALQDQPSVVAAARPPTAQDVARAQALLHRHDPRRLPAGGRGVLVLGQTDADLALAALARYAPELRAEVKLAARPARLAASWPVAGTGRWLNLGAELHPAQDAVALRGLRVGGVPVPDPVTAWAVDMARTHLQSSAEWGPLLASIDALTLDNGRIRLAYRAPQSLSAKLGAVLLPPDEVARLAVYHARLGDGLAGRSGSVPLPAVLAPLFAEVSARGSVPEEVRSALTVLAFHLAGRSLGTLVPEAAQWPRLPRRPVTLASRVDSAQHWAVSAFLAAAVGSPLADAVGLWKELQDSRRGSGFSFADLAADLAGTRAGEVLAGPRGAALARRLAGGVEEAALLPRLDDLPEGLGQTAFQARFGAPGDPRYEALKREVEKRVAALPLGPP